MPAAVTTVAMVKPFFLKNAFNLSRSGSFSTILSLSCSSWSLLSVFSVIRSRARSRTEGCSFSSSAILVSSCKVLLSSSISSSVVSISSVQCGPRIFIIAFGNFWLIVIPSALKRGYRPPCGPTTRTFPSLTSRVRSLPSLPYRGYSCCTNSWAVSILKVFKSLTRPEGVPSMKEVSAVP